VYAADSQAPDGYLQWHRWADDMYRRHGLRQSQCCMCSKWWFPQELSDYIEVKSVRIKGVIVLDRFRVCLQCFAKKESK